MNFAWLSSPIPGYGKPGWGDAVERENPHLLISAGDHVPALHKGQPVPITDTTAFGELVDKYSALFASTPWMPLLAITTHVLAVRKPPPEPAPDDVEATAFRQFSAARRAMEMAL